MQKTTTLLVVSLYCLLSLLGAPVLGQAEEKEELAKDTRCAVCGMFVAKFPQWLTKMQLQSGKNLYFDGVKDMMAYYFEPASFGGKKDDPPTAIEVKDYYKLQWLDGKKAFFVSGSDTTGPMGHELIPFAGKEAAETFAKDHDGKKIMAFTEITREQVEALRSGHKMK